MEGLARGGLHLERRGTEGQVSVDAGGSPAESREHRAGAGDAFITAVAVYPDDVTVLEPQLLKFYKDLLSTIEAAQHE